MIDMIRWCAVGLIMLSAILLGREYSAYADRRVSEQAGFIALLLHIEREIGSSLSYGIGLWRGFSDKSLEGCGFLPLLRDGCSPEDAFTKSSQKLALSGETKEKLLGFFSDFGKGYRDGEIKGIQRLRGELESDLNTLRPELEKNKRVINALLLGGAASAAIILI